MSLWPDASGPVSTRLARKVSPVVVVTQSQSKLLGVTHEVVPSAHPATASLSCKAGGCPTCQPSAASLRPARRGRRLELTLTEIDERGLISSASQKQMSLRFIRGGARQGWEAGNRVTLVSTLLWGNGAVAPVAGRPGGSRRST